MNGYVGALGEVTLANSHFRQVLFTGEHAQLVVMCLQPGEEIGEEVHTEVDQFFRVERGDARFLFHDKDERLAHDGDAVLIPARTRHNVVNASKTELLHLSTIYSPPNHPDRTIHETKADALAAESAHA
jgi:mannose-6-phosphate isomerase-like protein (cupin superfamily)